MLMSVSPIGSSVYPWASSSSTIALTIGGITYFSGNDSAQATALWRTDGTAAGTTVLAELSASNLFNFNGLLLFEAPVGNSSYLYRSDGTAAGTMPIAELSGDYTDPSFTQIGNELYFFEADSSGNPEIYRTDGTTSGTALVASLGSGEPTMATLNGTLYYFLSSELWEINPTGQPQLVCSIASDSYEGDYGGELTASGSKLYFTAPDPSVSDELDLWASDGTSTGTSVVWSFGPLLEPWGTVSNPQNLYACGGRLYFTTTGEYSLYCTDGTAAGTTQLGAADNLQFVNSFVADGSTLYFIATGGDRSALLSGLWATDGTVASTRLVSNTIGIQSGTIVLPTSSTVYFIGNGLIYETDGTTVSLADPTETTTNWKANIFVGQTQNGLVFSGEVNNENFALWSLSPAAPPTLSPIVPTLGNVLLKSSAIAGMNLGANLPVIVTNLGSAFASDLTFAIYADTGTTLSGSQILLASDTRKVALKTEHKARFLLTLKTLPATIAAGSYHLIVELIDPSGGTQSVATTQQVQISAPALNPSIYLPPLSPDTVTPGSNATVTVTITNDGNVPFVGTLTLSTTDDAALVSSTPSGIIVGTVHLASALPPGKQRRLRLHFRVPATLSAGNDFLNAWLSVKNATTATAFAPLTVS